MKPTLILNGLFWLAPGIECSRLMFDEDARKVRLSRFRLHCGERLRYEYDFNADWQLNLRLEKVLLYGEQHKVGGEYARY